MRHEPTIEQRMLGSPREKDRGATPKAHSHDNNSIYAIVEARIMLNSDREKRGVSICPDQLTP